MLVFKIIFIIYNNFKLKIIKIAFIIERIFYLTALALRRNLYKYFKRCEFVTPILSHFSEKYLEGLSAKVKLEYVEPLLYGGDYEIPYFF